jgi:hypothetical protein
VHSPASSPKELARVTDGCFATTSEAPEMVDPHLAV